MFVIEEEKKEKLSGMCENMLHYGGKMKQCLNSMEEADEDPDDESGYGERDEEDFDPDYPSAYGERMGMRGGYGRRNMNYGSRYSTGRLIPESSMGMRRRRR